jgi:hypothetical protein
LNKINEDIKLSPKTQLIPLSKYLDEYSGFIDDLNGLIEIDKIWAKYDVKKK